MRKTEIKKVRKGELVQIVNSKGEAQKKVWEQKGYCRTNKKYELQNIEDINDWKYVKGNKIVSLSD